MKVPSGYLPANVLGRKFEDQRQRVHRLIDNALIRTGAGRCAPKAIGSRSARPADQQRRANRQLSPPGGQGRVRIMKEARISKTDCVADFVPELYLLPKPFAKLQVDPNYISHCETVNR